MAFSISNSVSNLKFLFAIVLQATKILKIAEFKYFQAKVNTIKVQKVLTKKTDMQMFMGFCSYKYFD